MGLPPTPRGGVIPLQSKSRATMEQLKKG
jgi:hypothetical protein